MDQSPMYNPLERRVLRFLLIHCIASSGTFPDIDLKEFPWPTLDRLWNVFISSIRHSQFEFRSYLRPKSSASLKKQVQDMVAMAQFQMQFHSRTQTRSMINAFDGAVNSLQQAAAAVNSTTSHGAAAVNPTISHGGASVTVRRRIMTASHTTVTLVDEEVSVDQCISIHIIELSLTQVTESNNVDSSPYVGLSPDEILCRMVNREKERRRRIRWKELISVEWIRVAMKEY